MPNIPDDIIPGQRLARRDMNATWDWMRDAEARLARLELIASLRWAKTPGGGIVVGSSANCTVASRSPLTGAMTDGTATVKVWHMPGATDDVPGSTYIVYGVVQGVLQVIAVAC